MGENRFRKLKHRFDNREPSLSRLVLGTQIQDPLNELGASMYDLMDIISTTRTDTVKSVETTNLDEGYAFDSIVVEALDGSLHHAGNDSWSFSIAFAKWNSLRLGKSPSADKDNGTRIDTISMTTITMAVKLQTASGDVCFRLHKLDKSGNKDEPNQDRNAVWEELKPFLREGANHVEFFCLQDAQTLQFARASIWLWKASDKVVISDIDGTLTKSNARGVLGTILTQNYESATHSGVCDLLSRLAKSKTKTTTTTRVVYLTSRPIHLANKTRKFLSGLSQSTIENTWTKLPQGPLLGFGGNLAKVLSMEVVSKTSQAFKARELETHIARPFLRAKSQTSIAEIFVAAFGNNLNDVQAYHKIGVDLDKIFLIDKNSKIVTFQAPLDNEEQTPESFPPHSWYKDRISSVFDNGYVDKKLRSFLGVMEQ